MSKFSSLFAPAALALTALATPAAAQQFHPNESARAAGQTDFVQDNSGPNCVRDDFGFCAQPRQQTEQPRTTSGYETMVSHCGNRQWSDRWGQQLDSRIRGSLSGSVFAPLGSPYGRFRAQQNSACVAGEQIARLSEQYGGWENVPRDMQRSAERAWVVATQIAPQRQAERQINQVNRNWQERLADRIFGH